MAQRSLFFNSTAGKRRRYRAQDLAFYFGSVLKTGLLATTGSPGLKVTVEAGTLNVIVSEGKAIMKGHLYENTTPLTLAHSIPEPTLDRIDRIILRLNLQSSEQEILLHVKEGMPAANPVAPTLQRDEFIHEISIAQIRVRKNTVQLLPSDVTDERLDTILCGLVSSMLDIPTDLLQNLLLQRSSEINIASADFQTELTQMITDYQNEWQAWFDNIQIISPVTKKEFEESIIAVANDPNTTTRPLIISDDHVNGPPGGGYYYIRTSFYTDKENMSQLAQPYLSSGKQDMYFRSRYRNIITPWKRLLTQDDYDTLFQSVSNGKSLVGGAITDVDPTVVIPTNPTFPQLATAIRQISTKSKRASGTYTLSQAESANFRVGASSVTSFCYIHVIGLDFIPSAIRIYSGGTTYALHIKGTEYNGSPAQIGEINTLSPTVIRPESGGIIIDKSFKIAAMLNTSPAWGRLLYWEAFE